MKNTFKFLVGAVAAFALTLVVASTASAAYTHSTTLKYGMRSTQVMSLQQTLNTTTCKVAVSGAGSAGLETTFFGPATVAAVKCFQVTYGALPADGIVGPITGAKLVVVSNGSVSGNFPAGCTSAAGYSSTTGMRCDATPSSNFPAGCANASGYSPTTGVKCDSSASTPSTGALVGGAGNATVTELSTPSSSTKVGEGDDNTKVLGIDIEADNGSDLSITSMKITLQRTSGSGSDRLNRYATSVSIWHGSTKVGSANVADFSEAAGVYTKSINIANAIVRSGDTEKFYVTVDALDDIDSANTGSTNNTWTATLASTRYMDATGAILTDSTASIANTFIFDTLANTADVELKVNLSSDTLASKTVKISTTSDTSKVELLKFTMKAQGSKMVIDQIPVKFTTSGTLNEVTGNVTLVINGQTFNETVTSTASFATISFNELNLNVAANDTISGTVYADINDIESPLLIEGTTLVAEITSALVATTGSGVGALDAEDVNGDQLLTGDRTGSAVGNTMTFRSTGVNVVRGATSETWTTDTNGLRTSVTYTIPVSVTSFGNTLYMGQTGQLAATATASNAFAIVFENSSAPTAAVVSSMTNSITLSTSNATIESNGYRLDDGVTKNFTLTVNLTDPFTYNASYRVRLDDVRTFTEAGLVTGTSSDLLPQVDFRTGFQLINN